MNMNSIVVGALFGLATALAAAQGEAQLTFRVVSEQGDPLSGIELRMAMFDRPGLIQGRDEDIHRRTSGLTDAQGSVTLTLTSDLWLARCKLIAPPGFYPCDFKTIEFTGLANGKWQPWNPTNVVVLKPIMNPIPLYGKKVDMLPIPAQDTAIGFDLMAGDWVAPRGRGTNADLFFNLHRQFTNATLPFDLSVDITFPNDGDGLLAVSAPYRQGSILRLRSAPEAGYTNSLTKRIFRASVSTPIVVDTDENRSHFLRIRTQQSNGQITSALYGKIYGDIDLSAFGELRFTYYLNPTPNSRNLEFNTKSNLLKNLKSFENPNEP